MKLFEFLRHVRLQEDAVCVGERTLPLSDFGRDKGTGPNVGVRELLAVTLYYHWYQRPDQPLEEPIRESTEPDEDWVASLVATLPTAAGPDPGWKVLEDRGSLLLLERAGQRVLVASTQVDADPSGAVWNRPTHHSSPGWLHVAGPAREVLRTDIPLLRLYLNLEPAAVAQAMHQVQEALSSVDLPFELKVHVRPESLQRRSDSLVVYLPLRYREVGVRRILAQLGRDLTSGDVPGFTLPLRPGLSAAVSPLGGASFGLACCELAAAGMMHAPDDFSQWPELIDAGYAAAGWDLKRPWLGATPCDVLSSLVENSDSVTP